MGDDLRGWALGISWMEGWFAKSLEARKLDPAELREALGRLGFVYGAWLYDRPLLAPLFAFLALHRPGREVRFPLYVLIVLRWLRDRSVPEGPTRCVGVRTWGSRCSVLTRRLRA